MPADQLRLEQFLEIARGAQAARQHGLVGRGTCLRGAAPLAHELLEIDVAHVGAIDVLLAGGNRSDYGHGQGLQAGDRANLAVSRARGQWECKDSGAPGRFEI